jgi:hypothetical protein
MEERAVFTRFASTADERAMRLSVDDKARQIALVEEHHEQFEVVILMTPHRARAIGERLIAMADGVVAVEGKTER